MVGWLQPGAPPANSVNETINDTFAGSAAGGPLNVQYPGGVEDLTTRSHLAVASRHTD